MSKRDALDNAWRIHDAQADWTGKVDAKASFVFAIQSAALTAVLGLTGLDKIYNDLDAWWKVALYTLGLALLAAGGVLAGIVVAPRLRSKVASSEAHENFVYFGHAREWKPKELADQIRDGDIIDQLARQIIVMAKIGWVKHRLVQVSFWIGLGGGLVLVLLGVLLTAN